MALVGGTCWGFSGCCGQYLFEQKGIEAPWLVAVRLFLQALYWCWQDLSFTAGEESEGVPEKKGYHPLAGICYFRHYLLPVYILYGNPGIQRGNGNRTPVPVAYSDSGRGVHAGLRLPKGLELAAIGLSLFGTFVIGTHGDIHSFHITGEALFWGLLAAVSSMIYTIIPGGLILKYDIYQVLGFGMFFGGIAAMGPWFSPGITEWSGMLVLWERWQAWWWWALPLHLACTFRASA